MKTKRIQGQGKLDIFALEKVYKGHRGMIEIIEWKHPIKEESLTFSKGSGFVMGKKIP